jgi:hypothetical protein
MTTEIFKDTYAECDPVTERWVKSQPGEIQWAVCNVERVRVFPQSREVEFKTPKGEYMYRAPPDERLTVAIEDPKSGSWVFTRGNRIEEVGAVVPERKITRVVVESPEKVPMPPPPAVEEAKEFYVPAVCYHSNMPHTSPPVSHLANAFIICRHAPTEVAVGRAKEVVVRKPEAVLVKPGPKERYLRRLMRRG